LLKIKISRGVWLRFKIFISYLIFIGYVDTNKIYIVLAMSNVNYRFCDCKFGIDLL
jgi:hypothetical protein